MTAEELLLSYQQRLSTPEAVEHAHQNGTYVYYQFLMWALSHRTGDTLLQMLQHQIDYHRISDDPRSMARMDIFVQAMYDLTGDYSYPCK